jgi:recombination protein RecA
MPSAATLRLQIERSLECRFPAALTPVPRAARDAAATGIVEVDEHLEGGLPVGAISELIGPQSSGRTSLALAFAARRTAEGRACAWVDVSDAFDPESAAANGVVLPQLLWVRCRDAAAPAHPTAPVKLRAGKAGIWTRLDQALRTTDLLLQAGGFAAIVLDLGDTASEQANRIPLATWFRFRQAADRTRCSLVVLGRAAYAQSAAAVVLECKPLRAMTAGKATVRGFSFELRRRRERFAPVEIGTRNPTTGLGRSGGKPPVSTWSVGAAWDREREEGRRA